MSLVQAIGQMAREDVCEVLTQSGEALLTETDKKAKLKQVTVKSLSANTLIYRSDKVKFEKLLNSPYGTRHCDYVILTEYNETKRVLYIEMKSTSFKPEKYSEQLKGAEAMFHLICKVGSSFDLTSESVTDYQPHYVVLHKLPLTKSLTTLKIPANKSVQSTLELYVNDSNTLDIGDLIID